MKKCKLGNKKDKLKKIQVYKVKMILEYLGFLLEVLIVLLDMLILLLC